MDEKLREVVNRLAVSISIHVKAFKKTVDILKGLQTVVSELDGRVGKLENKVRRLEVRHMPFR